MKYFADFYAVAIVRFQRFRKPILNVSTRLLVGTGDSRLQKGDTCPCNTQSASLCLLSPWQTRDHFQHWPETSIGGMMHISPWKVQLRPQETLYKLCLLFSSLLILTWAKAATLLDFSLPISLLCEVRVQCDFVVFPGSQLPGYLSIWGVTL